MAERDELQKRYAYNEMSNKVQQADRSLLRSIRSEPTGEVESLWGRKNVGRMGDRVTGGPAADGDDGNGGGVGSDNHRDTSEGKKSRPVELEQKLERLRKKRLKDEQKQRRAASASTTGRRGASENILLASGGQTILDMDNIIGSYQPTNSQSRDAYELILKRIGSPSMLGTQPADVLKDAAQEVLTILKDPYMQDPEKHSELSKLLTGKAKSADMGMSSELYAQFVSWGKQINDFTIAGEDNQAADSGAGAAGEEEKMDEDMGVAVVFDESDGEGGSDDESGEEIGEVIDTSSSSSSLSSVDGGDDADNSDGGDDKETTGSMEDDEDQLVTLGGKKKSKKRRRGRRGSDDESESGSESDESNGDDDGNAGPSTKRSKKQRTTTASTSKQLNVHDIDAHWLQRQLSIQYKDANQSSQIADEVLDILSISDKRECENKLLVLLGFDLFDLIKLLLEHRLKIWGCIRLKRTDDPQECKEIESVLKQDPEGRQVWHDLFDKSSAEHWAEERMTSAASRMKQEAKQLVGSEGGGTVKSLSEATAKDKDIQAGEEAKSDEQQQQQQQMVTANEAHMINLDSLAFREGSRVMSNKTCELPKESWRAMHKGYEEVHVPYVKQPLDPSEKLISITSLPKWTHNAFGGMIHLNRVQSKMCDAALYTSENLLLCAPTGAGKTNVAMLTMLNIIGQYRYQQGDDEKIEDEADNIDLQSFKIVYVAPMKALVQEVVKNFSKRLKSYGITVKELSGDSSLTRQQISETQILVTTPEKWDIITRQGEGRTYTQLVKLMIFDEIHLLHDERGPVLENLVSRTIRQMEATQEPVRLVGLSATLPNYGDVATFLRVKHDKGLFFFDHTYRPVPLQQQYIGITERNAFKRFQLQNEICYQKALEQRKNGQQQMLIFVHSRAECGKTAKALRDLALERDELDYFVKEGAATQEILKEEVADVKHADLRNVLEYGFAIHHAGMTRSDRELVEDLFASHHIGVLCCTATLAWGVNLPAHAVIIKGTQIYDPSKGRWTELSPLDILQMLGRAGRPQYDTEGEGILMTQHSELQYYLSLMNLQLPVESQLIPNLPNHLNAEIVLGNIQTLKEAVDWLSYSFLYVRMLRNPSLYGILHAEDVLKKDPTLRQRRLDLVHSAATVLEKSHLIKYDRLQGTLHAAPLGRVASFYYISHSSMATYMRHLRPTMSDIELLRLFSMSDEFAHITVREEEKLELSKLASRVPIPVKESPSEPSAKVNILLQSYISRLTLDGFALMADMAFVKQSAARIMRALFEISLKRRWSQLTKLTLQFSNMISSRLWCSQSPLRQFPSVPDIVCRKLERKSDVEWSRYYDLSPRDLGELVGVPKMGRNLHKLVHQFPKLEVAAHVQPLTRSLLKMELILQADFQFDTKVHGFVQLFHIIVEDVNGELILHHELFPLRGTASQEEHMVQFTVPILDPLPPQYFVRVLSDRWLHSETTLPIRFDHLLLPSKFPPPTELLELQPLPVISALGVNSPLMKLYDHFQEFNSIQTQTFGEFYNTDRNILLCAPTGSGKTTCGEFALLRMFTTHPNGKCVYCVAKSFIVKTMYQHWNSTFGQKLGVKIGCLTGDTTIDIQIMKEHQIILTTVTHWDSFSRRWRQRSIKQLMQRLTVFIMDELHLLGGSDGPTMEIVLSRMRYLSQHLKSNSSQTPLRLIGLGSSMANARDVGEWMGVNVSGTGSTTKKSTSLFAFGTKHRPVPLDVYIQSFETQNFSSRLLAMSKPVYNAVKQHCCTNSSIKQGMVYVPSRRQAQLTAIDLITYGETLGTSSSTADGHVSMLIETEETAKRLVTASATLEEPALQQVVAAGVGFLHEGMLPSDFSTVLRLFTSKDLRVLVCPHNLCWKLSNIKTHLVVLMETQSFDGSLQQHVDYPIADMLQMMGHASRPASRVENDHGKCVILCHAPKKEFLKKLLLDPLPIESHLHMYLHDHMNSEIVTRTISDMQDAVDYVTWTFLYRRLSKNPNYYNLQGTTPTHLNEFVSDMVETVITDLEESKCCELSTSDETGGDVAPLNLGMIAAHYYIQYTTIELMASSVTSKTKVRGVVEILAASSEFATLLPIRQGEEKQLRILSRNLTLKIPSEASYTDPNTKALILLQCHFHRFTLPTAELRLDLNNMLREYSLKLLQALVDVISSNGWLKPALAAMEVSQMMVQAMWNKDSVLKQIPHFTKEIIQRCEAYKGKGNRDDDDDQPQVIESVLDILSLDDDVRNDLLQLPDDKMADVAVFCNNYPNMDVQYQIQNKEDDIVSGEPVQMVVTLERDVDEEEDDEDEESSPEYGIVSAPLFPSGTDDDDKGLGNEHLAKKKEGWWIVLGDTSNNTILSLKRTTFDQVTQTIKLDFMAPDEPGDYNLTLFVMSDSYLGCDQEYDVSMNVAAGGNDDDDDDDSSSSASLSGSSSSSDGEVDEKKGASKGDDKDNQDEIEQE